MNLSSEILDAMVESGCTAAQIAAVVKAALTTRSTNAERQARFRNRKKALSEEAVDVTPVTESVTSNVTTVTIVTDNAKVSPPLVPPLSPAPLSPPIIPPASKTTPHQTRAILENLETELRNAAGWQREPSPKLFVTGQIAGLLDAGCDLDLDVLPTVKSLAPNCRGVKTWKYFIGAIQQARDDRLSAAVPFDPSKPRPANHHDNYSKPPKIGSIERSNREVNAVIDELERREIAAGKSGGAGNPIQIPRLRQGNDAISDWIDGGGGVVLG